MSGTVKYTAYASSGVPVIFRCEHCGKVTLVNHVLRTQSSEIVRTFSSRQSHQYGELSAEMYAKATNIRLREEVIEDAKRRKYGAAGFNCKCSNCMEKPLWAKIAHLGLNKLIDVLLVLAFFVFCFSMLAFVNGEFDSGLGIVLFAVIPCLVGAVALKIGITVHKKVIERKILEMDEKYLPVICTTPDEIETNLKRMAKEDDYVFSENDTIK